MRSASLPVGLRQQPLKQPSPTTKQPPPTQRVRKRKKTDLLVKSNRSLRKKIKEVRRTRIE